MQQKVQANVRADDYHCVQLDTGINSPNKSPYESIQFSGSVKWL